jgi:hypothetical protein
MHTTYWLTKVTNTHTHTHTHTHRIYNTYYFSSVKMVTRTRLNIMFMLFCHYFYIIIGVSYKEYCNVQAVVA